MTGEQPKAVRPPPAPALPGVLIGWYRGGTDELLHRLTTNVNGLRSNRTMCERSLRAPARVGRGEKSLVCQTCLDRAERWAVTVRDPVPEAPPPSPGRPQTAPSGRAPENTAASRVAARVAFGRVVGRRG